MKKVGINKTIMAYTYKYPRPAVTTDCVVITKEKLPKILLIQRGNEPFKDYWAFPGGFMEMDETIEQCAVRELEEETGIRIDISDLTLLGVYSKVDRDPRGRTISVAYLVEIDAPVEAKGQDDAAKAEWFGLTGAPVGAFDHEDIFNDVFKVLEERTKSDLREAILQDKIKELKNNI